MSGYTSIRRTPSWLGQGKLYFLPVLWAGSPVGIATGYGLGGPGIESMWGARFSAFFLFVWKS